MTLEEDGAAHLPGAAAPFLARLEAALAGLPAERAGIRLHGVAGDYSADRLPDPLSWLGV